MLEQPTLQRLENARASEAASMTFLNALERDVAALYDAFVDAEARRASVSANPRLTEKAKREDFAKVREETDQIAAGIMSRAEDRIAAEVERLERAATPGEPTGDRTLFEAQLANARNDLQLALSGEAGDQVVKAMEELAQGDDKAAQHLLLATEWGSYYLRSRNLGHLIPLWRQARRSLQHMVLDARGVEALQRLEKLKEVRQIPLLMTHALDMFQKRHPMNASGATRA